MEKILGCHVNVGREHEEGNYRCDCDSKSPGNRKIWLKKKSKSLVWAKRTDELGSVVP